LLKRSDPRHLTLGDDPGEGEAGLIDEGGVEPALVGANRIAAIVAPEAEHRARRAAGDDGDEQPVRRRQRVGPAPRRLRSVERPIGGGAGDGVQRILRGDGGDDR